MNKTELMKKLSLIILMVVITIASTAYAEETPALRRQLPVSEMSHSLLQMSRRILMSSTSIRMNSSSKLKKMAIA